MMMLTSTRDARPEAFHRDSGRTFVAGFFRANPPKAVRASRWVAVIYVVVALATPLLLYAGPETMSPAAPVIADKALDGQLAGELHWPHP